MAGPAGYGRLQGQASGYAFQGHQQKIQLITAVIHDPQIIMLDEPFSGLDPVNAALLKDVVKEEVERGKIVLFSSHQMGYIEEFLRSDRRPERRGNCPAGASGGNQESISQGPAADPVVRGIRYRRGVSVRLRTGGEGPFVSSAVPSCKQEVMERLTGRFDIDEIRVLEPSLNDIFVEYTKERI